MRGLRGVRMAIRRNDVRGVLTDARCQYTVGETGRWHPFVAAVAMGTRQGPVNDKRCVYNTGRGHVGRAIAM